MGLLAGGSISGWQCCSVSQQKQNPKTGGGRSLDRIAVCTGSKEAVGASCAPPLARLPAPQARTFTLAGMLYLAPSMPASLARTMRSPGANVTGASVGNSSSMPGFCGSSVNRQGALLRRIVQRHGGAADIEQLHVLRICHVQPDGT